MLYRYLIAIPCLPANLRLPGSISPDQLVLSDRSARVEVRHEWSDSRQ